MTSSAVTAFPWCLGQKWRSFTVFMLHRLVPSMSLALWLNTPLLHPGLQPLWVLFLEGALLLPQCCSVYLEFSLPPLPCTSVTLTCHSDLSVSIPTLGKCPLTPCPVADDFVLYIHEIVLFPLWTLILACNYILIFVYKYIISYRAIHLYLINNYK